MESHVVVAAVAAAAAATGGSGGGMWLRLQRWLVARWLRYGGAAIWPPRRQTAPLYLGVWAAVSAALYFGFVRVGRSRESEWEAKRKSEFAEASIKNLLEYEQKRRDEEAEEETKKASDSSGTTTGAEGDDDKDKKTAPDVQKMLSLLYDEVEAGAITKLGVDKHEGWYRSAVGAAPPRPVQSIRTSGLQPRIQRL
jgi:hypothetical protein